jgi:hypothetical protein
MTKKTTTLFHTNVFLSISCLTRKETTMPMKSALTRALGLSLVLLGALAAAPTADAGVATNHSGTICKNVNSADVTFIYYSSQGTLSSKTSATPMICPLTRNTGNTQGAIVYVDIKHGGTQTTNCSAYSYDYDGRFLAAKSSGNLTFSGFQEIRLDLSTHVGDPQKSTTWSDYSVRCDIPGNGNAVILGVDLSEQ